MPQSLSLANLPFAAAILSSSGKAVETNLLYDEQADCCNDQACSLALENLLKAGGGQQEFISWEGLWRIEVSELDSGNYLLTLIPQKTLSSRHQRVHDLIDQFNLQESQAGNLEPALQGLLRELLDLFGSEYGLIGQVEHPGNPELRAFNSYVMVAHSIDSAAQHWIDRSGSYLGTRNLDNMLGAPVEQKDVVVFNDLHITDPSRGDVADHPPITSYIGIPFKWSGKVIGLLAMCNKQDGYTDKDVELGRFVAVHLSSLIELLNVDKAIGGGLNRTRTTTELYEILQVCTSEGLWRWEVATNSLWCSDKVLKLIGRASDSQYGQKLIDWVNYIHAQDLGRFQQEVVAYIKSRSDDLFNFRFRIKTGQGYQWFLLRGRSIFDFNGDVESMFGSVANIHSEFESQLEFEKEAELLKLGAEASGVGHWTIALPSGETTWSEQMYSIYGVPSEAINLAVDDMLDYVVARDRASVSNMLMRAVTSGEDFSVATQIETGYGDTREVFIKAIAQMDEEGNPVLLLGAVQDLTEEREHLREITRLYHVLENTNVGVVVSDLAKGIEWINPAFTEMTGFNWGDMEGTDLFDMLRGPLTDPAAEEFFRYKLQLMQSGQEEFCFQNKSGENFWVNISIAPLNYDGVVSGYTYILQDITDRKEKEGRLLQLETLVLKSEQLAMFLDTEEPPNIIYTNRIVEQMTGFSRDELLGKPFSILEADADASSEGLDRRYLSVCRLRQMDFRGVVQIKRKDDSLSWIFMHMMPIHDKKGELAYFGVLLKDINRERLAEKRLERTQKMEAVGQLVGGIAHDFNNILGILSGHAELIELYADGQDKVKKHVDGIVNTVDRAIVLTKKLLQFSRADATCSERFDAGEMLLSFEDFLERTLTSSVALTIDIDSTEPAWINVDKSDFENVIVNLAINGRDAMDGRGALRISCSVLFAKDLIAQRSDDFELIENRYVVISVIDNGYGISAQNQARIFDPFFTTKEKESGTGLGLSLAYGFVKRSHGFISCHSVLGKGTRFDLIIPVSEIAPTRQLVVDNAEEDEVSLDGKRVLVADDEIELREVISSWLELWGAQVISVSNVEQAKRKLESEGGFDLLLTDIIMSGAESGLDLAFYTEENFSDINVVVMTGFHGFENNEKLARFDGNVLNKPFGRKQLQRVISKLTV
ncbi:MAG: PAS domain S-box protein [Cellvibrionaceae bacterium]